MRGLDVVGWECGTEGWLIHTLAGAGTQGEVIGNQIKAVNVRWLETLIELRDKMQ